MHAQIVIQESMSSYLRPVTRDFSARLELQSEIREEDIVAVTFSGRYVLFPKSRAI